MRFTVKTLRRADADIREITDYLFRRSPSGAAAWLDALERATNRLAEFADGCSVAEENHRLDIDVRQALFKTRRGLVYRIVFTIVVDEVRILRVRGPGQAPVEPHDLT